MKRCQKHRWFGCGWKPGPCVPTGARVRELEYLSEEVVSLMSLECPILHVGLIGERTSLLWRSNSWTWLSLCYGHRGIDTLRFG